MATLIDSYSESNQTISANIYSSQPENAQIFQCGVEGYRITKATFYLQKNGSPTGNCRAKLYAITGTVGSTAVPTGSALAVSGDVDVTTLSGSHSLIDFTFTGANNYKLANGQAYAISFEYTGGDGSNSVYVGLDNTSPSHAGNRAYYFGGWTPTDAQDGCFYVYGDIISSASISPSFSASSSQSASISPSASLSGSPSASQSPSGSTSASESKSASSSQSKSQSPSSSGSASTSPSASVSPSVSSSQAPGEGFYSKVATVTLPVNKDNLAILYGEDDERDVSTDDGVRVRLTGESGQYLIHQYRIVNTNNRDSIKVKVNLQSTLAPTSSPVHLQIWNVTGSLWETLTSNNTTGANTDFDLESTIISNLSDYYDSDLEIALRVYQVAT